MEKQYGHIYCVGSDSDRYRAITDEIRKMHKPVDKSQLEYAKELLDATQMKGERALAFFNRIKSLANKAYKNNPANHEQIREKFIDGLEDEALRRELLINKELNVAQMLEYCAKSETASEYISNSRNSRSRQTTTQFQLHHSAEPSHRVQSGQDARTISRATSSNHNNSHQSHSGYINSNHGIPPRQNNFRLITCGYCHRNGHVEDECRQKRLPSAPRMPPPQ
jgi:hypothetical protein